LCGKLFVCLLTCLHPPFAAPAAGIAVAELDFGLLSAVRAKMPIKEHRAKGRAQLA
jgi:hypothetical protein